jgi:hypothetical protein
MVTPQGRIYPDRLITYGNTAGHRGVTLTFAINDGHEMREVELVVSSEDALRMMWHVVEVNKLAWHDTPLDVKPGETRPKWLAKI